MSSKETMRRLRFSEALEPAIDDIVELVQSGSDCEINNVSAETWLAIKAKILAVYFQVEEEREG